MGTGYEGTKPGQRITDCFEREGIFFNYRNQAKMPLKARPVQPQQDPQNADTTEPGTYPCKRARCRTCSHTDKSNRIRTPCRDINIKKHFTCTSTQVIYCISCKKCSNVIYIGETGRKLAERFREHRRNVIKKREGPVPKHFNEINHTVKDMKVAVVKRLGSASKRKEEEMRMIIKHKTLKPRGLNQLI